MLAEGEFSASAANPDPRDVRVIAATHQNLDERVREACSARTSPTALTVIRIELPPLRARGEDIPDLLGHYMRVAAAELGVEAKSLSPQAIERLGVHHWPGNVRELVNLCRRLSVLAPGREVHVADLPAELTAQAPQAAGEGEWAAALAGWAERHAQTGAAPLLDAAQPQFERVLIRAALKRTGGHRQEAAKLLGWGRNTLTRKLKELGMNGTPGA